VSEPGELWIVDPSRHEPEDEGEGEIRRAWNGPARRFRPALVAGDCPAPGSGYPDGAIVVMGSAASVYDRDPWIETLSEWLRPVVLGRVRVPLLGICFGHQLVAHIAGAEVAFGAEDRSKIVGIRSTRFGGSRLVEDGELRVVTSHREQVRDVPPGFRRVASRPDCAIDGIEHRDLPVFAVQFHPEARVEFATRAGIDPAQIDATVRRDSQRVLEAFSTEAVRAGRR
jgi:GMP synthase-like glutamine amidotransferase